MENLEKNLSALGLTAEEIAVIKEDKEITADGFKERFKSNIINDLKADETFINEITEPIKGQVIGKQKQLAKLVKSKFGLLMDSKTVETMDFSELLDKAKEQVGASITTNDEVLKAQLMKEMDEKEKLEEAYKKQLEDLESSYKNQIAERDVMAKLIEYAEGNEAIAKENASYIANAFYKLKKSDGHKIILDEKNHLRLVDGNGIALKDSQGNTLTVNKGLTDFVLMFNGNIKPKGTTTTTTTSKSNSFLDALGTGFR